MVRIAILFVSELIFKKKFGKDVFFAYLCNCSDKLTQKQTDIQSAKSNK